MIHNWAHNLVPSLLVQTSGLFGLQVHWQGTVYMSPPFMEVFCLSIVIWKHGWIVYPQPAQAKHNHPLFYKTSFLILPNNTSTYLTSHIRNLWHSRLHPFLRYSLSIHLHTFFIILFFFLVLGVMTLGQVLFVMCWFRLRQGWTWRWITNWKEICCVSCRDTDRPISVLDRPMMKVLMSPILLLCSHDVRNIF